jgi:cyclopropane fatty-acyl-phospholipid synthase-like methyltransferase
MKKFISRLFFWLFYMGDPPWDTGISPPELIRFIDNNPSGRALDLGCGTGTNAITLAQHGWQVTAVDFIGRAIRTARRKAKHASVEIDFRVGDVTRLDDIHGPFDLIVDIGCFHSLSHQGQDAYIDNIERLLADQGTFLLYAYFRLPDESRAMGGGLKNGDLERLETQFRLVQREDGSERGKRPSAWFWFER